MISGEDKFCLLDDRWIIRRGDKSGLLGSYWWWNIEILALSCNIEPLLNFVLLNSDLLATWPEVDQNERFNHQGQAGYQLNSCRILIRFSVRRGRHFPGLQGRFNPTCQSDNWCPSSVLGARVVLLGGLYKYFQKMILVELFVGYRRDLYYY